MLRRAEERSTMSMNAYLSERSHIGRCAARAAAIAALMALLVACGGEAVVYVYPDASSGPSPDDTAASFVDSGSDMPEPHGDGDTGIAPRDTTIEPDGSVAVDAVDATSPPDPPVPPDPDTGVPPVNPPPVDPPDDPDPPGPDVELVSVSHAREFRGVWVATVANINFPSRQGLSADALRAELIALLDVTAAAGLNAIVFQVRPEGDALYASPIEPWSRFLTGTQGGNPGMDPLATLIQEAHHRNIEVHAWLNPYRAKSTRSSTAVAPHMSVVHSAYAYEYGSSLWMDPGAAPVQQRLRDVVADLVRRYDLDGIHFDDYFYPYPDGPFPDTATFNAYTAAGGTLSRDDWRRDNVNQMVRDVSRVVAEIDDSVRFGISPFGIYRPGQPEGIRGLDQYAAIFADPVRWMDEGWVDYVAPQLYWPTTQTAQAYEPLLRWWTEVHPELYVFAGNYLSKLGSEPVWSIQEFRDQLRISRSYRAGNSMGNIYFQIRPLMTNQMNIATIFRDEFYPAPALTPPLVSARFRTVVPPRVEVAGTTLTVEYRDARPQRATTVYRPGPGDTWVLDRVIPPSQSTFMLPAGRWAVASVSRDSVESQGVVVTTHD